MDSILQALVLGLVQGVTEFIPVSSSGHLILVRDFFGIVATPADLAFDAVLQLATAISVAWYFRKDLINLLLAFGRKLQGHHVDEEYRVLFLSLVLGTIPAVLAGLLLEDSMETLFRSSTLVAWTLIVGAVLMYSADRIGSQKDGLTVRKGFFVGLFQVLALVPGISRSGATISGGLFAGLNRENAIRFSFLLGFPILFGSGIKKLLELLSAGALDTLGASLVIGSIAAFVSGLAAIHFLVSYLKRHGLSVFVFYRVALAVLILVFL